MATPLISHPFRVTPAGTVATVEDGSTAQTAEELVGACLTRPGERVLVPDFGIADPVFTGFDANALRMHVQLFGPPVDIDDVTVESLDGDRQDVVVEFSTSD